MTIYDGKLVPRDHISVGIVALMRVHTHTPSLSGQPSQSCERWVTRSPTGGHLFQSFSQSFTSVMKLDTLGFTSNGRRLLLIITVALTRNCLRVGLWALVNLQRATSILRFSLFSQKNSCCWLKVQSSFVCHLNQVKKLDASIFNNVRFNHEWRWHYPLVPFWTRTFFGWCWFTCWPQSRLNGWRLLFESK